MHSFYVVGNLKMNLLSHEEAAKYLQVLEREAGGHHFERTLGIICPPAVYLRDFARLPKGFQSGAQNVFWEKSGSFTGELSPLMIKNCGAEYVILGHSERRSLGETDEMVKQKVDAALRAHLIPIVCVGETKAEREADQTPEVVEEQMAAVFSGLSKMQAEKVILAYEPRWAIGSDITPSTSEILQVKVLLRKRLSEFFDRETAERIAVVYGGSVTSVLLPQVSWEAEMDGVLVGRESLFPHEVVKMMELAEEALKEKATV